MKTTLGRSLFLAALLSAQIAGCAVGPDYQRPDLGVDVPASYRHADEKTDAARAVEALDDAWWKMFGNPELDKLVEEVAARNLDVKKAAARVIEAKTAVTQARADRVPQVNLQGQAVRAHQTVEVAQPGPIQIGPGGAVTVGPSTIVETPFTTWNYNLSANLGFELDFWGKLARTHEAARAGLLQAEESRRLVLQSVIAEAVTQYLRIETVERRLALAEGNVESSRKTVAYVEGRYKSGIGDALAVRQARRGLAQAESTLPPLRQELGQAQQTLAVLLGRYPETGPPRVHTDAFYKDLAPVPPGLPSDLLQRRPDVRAAEAALIAANARIGAAKASRFPSFSLTGSLGYSSNELDQIFQPASQVVSGGVGLLAPLFNFGKLKAVQEGAEARYTQTEADYIKTVLSAFAEVEASLLNRKELIERRELILALAVEARATQEAAESRYALGLVDFLNVLEARQSRYAAEDSLILAEQAVLANRVGLHRALGGGWEVKALAIEEEKLANPEPNRDSKQIDPNPGPRRGSLRMVLRGPGSSN